MITVDGRRVLEVTFRHDLVDALGALPGVFVHVQNVASTPVAGKNAAGEDTFRVIRTGLPKGAADLSGMVEPEGWRLEVELKMPGKKREPAQEMWAVKIIRGGGVYACITYDADLTHPANLARAVAILRQVVEDRRARHGRWQAASLVAAAEPFYAMAVEILAEWSAPDDATRDAASPDLAHRALSFGACKRLVDAMVRTPRDAWGFVADALSKVRADDRARYADDPKPTKKARPR